MQESLRNNIKNTIKNFSLNEDDSDKLTKLSKYPSALWIDTRFRIKESTLPCGNIKGICPLQCKSTGCENKQITYNKGNSLQQALININNSDEYNAILIIIYDLPGRDCHASASNGLICPAKYWNSDSKKCLNEYKNNYIDNIYNLLNDDKYKNISKVLIIEPDSFPNCITNATTTDGTGGFCKMDMCYKSYFPGIQYALEKFNNSSNCYCYLDMAHNNWLGWDLSFNSANNKPAIINLFNGNDGVYQNFQTIIKYKNSKKNEKDFPYDISKWPSMIYGFSLNVSNYNPLGTMCPFSSIQYSDDRCNVYENNVKELCNNMQAIKNYIHTPSSMPNAFKDCLKDYCSSGANYNQATNLLNFSYILNLALKNIKFKNSLGPGIIIDVSRNGSPISELYPERGKTMTQPASQCGSWCNQLNSTSNVPKLSPLQEYPFIHGYLWLKTPGESDGCIDPSNISKSPPDNGKYGNYSLNACKLRKSQNQTYCPRSDNMCGLTYLAGYNNVPSSTGEGWIIDDITKLRGQYCPPTAGKWDDLQILQLSGVGKLSKNQIPQEYPNPNIN